MDDVIARLVKATPEIEKLLAQVSHRIVAELGRQGVPQDEAEKFLAHHLLVGALEMDPAPFPIAKLRLMEAWETVQMHEAMATEPPLALQFEGGDHDPIHPG